MAIPMIGSHPSLGLRLALKIIIVLLPYLGSALVTHAVPVHFHQAPARFFT
jgi:hypothetical protein